MRVRTRLAAGLGAVALALAGCGGGDPAGSAGSTGTDPTVLRAATLRPGDPVPPATGAALLTVAGATADGRSVRVDRQLLAGLTQIELRTYEPWVRQDLTFRGVWLADLLAVAGAGPDASVQITALDDYTVTLPAADLRAGGILLATSDGAGADIPVGAGGPTRIVYVGGLRSGANADNWIWSLRTVDVR